jgi:hypothetical protein
MSLAATASDPAEAVIKSVVEFIRNSRDSSLHGFVRICTCTLGVVIFATNERHNQKVVVQRKVEKQ